MGVQPEARALCSRSALPELQFCPCGLCLAKHVAGLRAAVMSVKMLLVHVDVKLAASDGCGTSMKDTLMQICVSVWRLSGDSDPGPRTTHASVLGLVECAPDREILLSHHVKEEVSEGCSTSNVVAHDPPGRGAAPAHKCARSHGKA
eukprot:1861846-Rhodomonas_salina.1